MENPYDDNKAQPTGIIIGRSEGYDVHMDNLLDQADRTNTALELNANPQRFDLTTEWLQKAASKGIPIAVNTDAHNTQSIHFINYGYRRAKRAWIQKQDIINTRIKDNILKLL